MGWFRITQFNDKRAIPIANLVETMWLMGYPYPTQITYDQVSEIISCELKNCLIQAECGIKANTILSGISNYNVML